MGDAEENSHQKLQNLIPGLPDDIAVDCLVRVPQEFHSNMKSVCHNWHSLISHPSFYRERLKSGTAEHLVFLVQPIPKTTTTTTTDAVIQGYTNKTSSTKKEEENHNHHPQQEQKIHSPLQYGLSIYNATHDRWQRIRPKRVTIPMFSQCMALPSSDKLILLGGWDPTTLDPVPHLYILDFIKGECRRAAPMSVPRSFFACAVVGPSTVYVAGGHDNHKNALKSAEVYHVDADEWKMLPSMAEERDECQGLSWSLDGNGRFWVVSGYGTENQGEFRSDAEYYDPLSGSWSKVDGVWPFQSMSPRGGTTTVSVDSGNGYQWWWLLSVEGQQQQQHGEVKEYEEKEKKWKVVSSIPLLPNSIIGTSPCVTNFGLIDKSCNKQHDRVFMMSGECDGQGAFIMERDRNSGNTKWNHIHTPLGFSGFPYSASYLLV